MQKTLVILLSIAWLASGCDSLPRNKDKELEQVAKDWSMTIRASQIIPVYPLTEDLQPGDVFLVQVPIDQQQTVYKEKGFLPLDNLVDRIQPHGFCTFYGQSFMNGAEACKPLPVTWLTPGNKNAWAAAPGASFPTYSFSARKGGGFNLALPVQGVPVGVSLLGGDAAQGSVTIAEAKTYGLDTVSLYKDVKAWAAAHTDFLDNFAPTDNHQNYLRVVSRVYLTGSLTVTLQSARSASGGLTAGASKPVDVFSVRPGDKPEAVTAEAYKENLKTINETIAGAIKNLTDSTGALPGGSVSVVAASANAVTLKEDFPRPLVIGYLGFDVAIGEHGALGPPIPTHAVLTNQQTVVPAAKARVEQRQTEIEQIVKAVTDPATKQLDTKRMEAVFKGTAFERLSTDFQGKTPQELQKELGGAKYRSSISVFKANADRLSPQ